MGHISWCGGDRVEIASILKPSAHCVITDGVASQFSERQYNFYQTQQSTLSALIPPALIPPHFANVAVIRAGGRKGRRKKGPAEEKAGGKRVRVQGDSKKYPTYTFQ